MFYSSSEQSVSPQSLRQLLCDVDRYHRDTVEGYWTANPELFSERIKKTITTVADFARLQINYQIALSLGSSETDYKKFYAEMSKDGRIREPSKLLKAFQAKLPSTLSFTRRLAYYAATSIAFNNFERIVNQKIIPKLVSYITSLPGRFSDNEIREKDYTFLKEITPFFTHLFEAYKHSDLKQNDSDSWEFDPEKFNAYLSENIDAKKPTDLIEKIAQVFNIKDIINENLEELKRNPRLIASEYLRSIDPKELTLLKKIAIAFLALITKVAVCFFLFTSYGRRLLDSIREKQIEPLIKEQISSLDLYDVFEKKLIADQSFTALIDQAKTTLDSIILAGSYKDPADIRNALGIDHAQKLGDAIKDVLIHLYDSCKVYPAISDGVSSSSPIANAIHTVASVFTNLDEMTKSNLKALDIGKLIISKIGELNSEKIYNIITILLDVTDSYFTSNATDDTAQDHSSSADSTAQDHLSSTQTGLCHIAETILATSPSDDHIPFPSPDDPPKTDSEIQLDNLVLKAFQAFENFGPLENRIGNQTIPKFNELRTLITKITEIVRYYCFSKNTSITAESKQRLKNMQDSFRAQLGQSNVRKFNHILDGVIPASVSFLAKNTLQIETLILSALQSFLSSTAITSDLHTRIHQKNLSSHFFHNFLFHLIEPEVSAFFELKKESPRVNL